MIKIVRLDERLIHGQIGVAWASLMETDSVVVLNDKAANNPIMKKTLLVAAPRNNKTVVKTMEDGIHMLHDPRCEEKKIFVIVGNWEDLLLVLTQVKGIHYVNIGNFGRQTNKNSDMERKQYGTDIYLDETELATIKKIIEFAENQGIRLEVQTIPQNKAVPLSEVVSGKQEANSKK